MIQITIYKDEKIQRPFVEEDTTWGVWALHPDQDMSQYWSITHIPTGLAVAIQPNEYEDMLRLLYALPPLPKGLASYLPANLDDVREIGSQNKTVAAGIEITRIIREWRAVYC